MSGAWVRPATPSATEMAALCRWHLDAATRKALRRQLQAEIKHLFEEGERTP